MAMVYIGCGIFCFAFPNNVILVKIGLSANGWRIIAVAVSFFGGLYINVNGELFTLNKRSWNKKKREEKQCWWWLKILFILIFLFSVEKTNSVYSERSKARSNCNIYTRNFSFLVDFAYFVWHNRAIYFEVWYYDG